jgi:hypothetical protein
MLTLLVSNFGFRAGHDLATPDKSGDLVHALHEPADPGRDREHDHAGDNRDGPMIPK